jgi:hypothetical protein
MARRPTGLTELIAFLLTPADKAKLEALARRQHRTVSQLLRILVERETRSVHKAETGAVR